MEKHNHNLEKITITINDELKTVQYNFDFLSEKGKYLFESIQYRGKLEKVLEDLEMVKFFLDNYPYGSNTVEFLNEVKYINFHLEVFYHKISTILDIIKLFVCHVFELQLLPEVCNWKNLEKRKNEINPGVFDVIVRYYKSFESIIRIRDLNTHRLNNVNPASTQLSTLLLILETFENGGHLVSKQSLDYSLQKHREKIIEHITSASEVAKKYVDEITNKILVEVVKREESK